MKTIAQQLNVTEFPFIINNSKGNKIYWEDIRGNWYKKEYDSKDNQIYFEDSYGYWFRSEYDLNNNEIYFKNSDGTWYKREYDSNNNLIYYESSNGTIIDNRPQTVELTLDEIAEKFGIDVKLLKIKK